MARPPTEQEKKELEKIDAKLKLHHLTAAIALISMLLFLGPLSDVPEQYRGAKVIFAVAVIMVVVGIHIYLACFLRCPRCSGWIAFPKCPCGLKLEKYAKR